MFQFRFFKICCLFLLLQNCTEKKTSPYQAYLLPSEAKPLDVKISDLNCWVEQDKFFVTGICSNQNSAWQKIWLEGTPVNAAGKPIQIAGCKSVIIPTFSDAIPPSGRTSFFVSWPVSDFSELPTSCKLQGAGAVVQSPGPILICPMVDAMKMLVPPTPGQPATEETAWKLNGSIINPLSGIASRPMLEVLVFGTDERLWLSTQINPQDASGKQIFQFEREGPFQAKEERKFTLQVYYAGLPQVLKEKKIGRIEVLPFEAR